jgi:hypothetical protein
MSKSPSSVKQASNPASVAYYCQRGPATPVPLRVPSTTARVLQFFLPDRVRQLSLISTRANLNEWPSFSVSPRRFLGGWPENVIESLVCIPPLLSVGLFCTAIPVFDTVTRRWQKWISVLHLSRFCEWLTSKQNFIAPRLDATMTSFLVSH